MITIYDRRCSTTLSPGETAPTSLPADTVWVDLYNETEDEAALVERLIRRRLPNRHRLAEVETSSRLSDEGDALVMSSPIIYRSGPSLLTTPVGFVLTRDLLVTLRQEELRSFSDFIHEVKSHETEPLESGSAAWLGLVESIVDRVADGMEAVGADLEKVSRHIFQSSVEPGKGRPTNVEAKLRETLETVGRSGDTTGYVRDSLLGLGRMPATCRPMPTNTSRSGRQAARQHPPGHRLAQRLRDAPHQQGPVPARLDAGTDQHRAEPHVQAADRRLGDRHPTHLRGRALRHELQDDARIRLGLGVPVGAVPGRAVHRRPGGAAALERLGVRASRLSAVPCVMDGGAGPSLGETCDAVGRRPKIE